jgi:hypothetical protein
VLRRPCTAGVAAAAAHATAPDPGPAARGGGAAAGYGCRSPPAAGGAYLVTLTTVFVVCEVYGALRAECSWQLRQVLASLLLDLRLWAAAPVAVQQSLFALCLKLSQVRHLVLQGALSAVVDIIEHVAAATTMAEHIAFQAGATWCQWRAV